MMKDPYDILALRRGATGEEIKRSYRRLAKTLHPDLNPGDQAVEQKFKELTSAYELLSDPGKRARFDRGEIDANGAERGFGFGSGGFGRSPRASAGARRPSPEDDAFADDLVAELLRARRSGRTGDSQGADASFALHVPFIEAALGVKKRVAMADGKTLEVALPAGVETGQTLRLKGQGHPGRGKGAPGDALIEITVEPHASFTRKDRDIHCELPVSLPEAVLGATITAPTIHGPVTLKIPSGSNNGTALRLRGKGIPERGGGAAGDHYAKLRIVLPEPPDAELTQFLEGWAHHHAYDVRDKA